jgi:hypothetical protein
LVVTCIIDYTPRFLTKITGRAVAIAAEKQSFDLCDDPFGPGVSVTLNDPEYLKRFGTGSAAVRGEETALKRTSDDAMTPAIDAVAEPTETPAVA